MFRPLMLLLALLSAMHTYAQGYGEEIGKAAYYSDKLQGKKTASGKPYDKNALTCAHKTYDFGTKLRVTRIDNNQSVIVTVTDRGPFREGHVVDLSRRAAEAIDLVKAGVARVKVEPAETPEKKGPGTMPGTAPVNEGDRIGDIQIIKAYDPEMAVPAPAEHNDTRLVSKGSPGMAAASLPVMAMNPAPAGPTAKAPAKSNAKAASKLPAADAKPASKPAAKPAPAAVKSEKLRAYYQISARKPALDGFAVQIAVLSNPNTAMQEATKVETKWPGKILLMVETDESGTGDPLFKLMIGPYADRKTADQGQADAIRKGYRKAFVVDMTVQ